jgi:hypothetical protein
MNNSPDLKLSSLLYLRYGTGRFPVSYSSLGWSLFWLNWILVGKLHGAWAGRTLLRSQSHIYSELPWPFVGVWTKSNLGLVQSDGTTLLGAGDKTSRSSFESQSLLLWSATLCPLLLSKTRGWTQFQAVISGIEGQGVKKRLVSPGRNYGYRTPRTSYFIWLFPK